MLPKTLVTEETSNRTAGDMVAHLVADHEQLTKRIRDVASAADKADDLSPRTC